MGSDATVSVVIPTCNAQPYLEECINSVLGQSHRPAQVIICDDASTDGTQDIILRYRDRQPNIIEAVLHKENHGIAFNFNSGFERVAEKYVSIIAGDDLWNPNKLKCELEVLEADPLARWAYSNSYIIDSESQYVKQFSRMYDGCEGNILKQVLTHQMTLRNWVAERSLIKEIGMFDTQFQIFEDWDYKIRLAKAAHVKYVPEENVAYRQHPKGISRSSGDVFLRNLQRVHKKCVPIVNCLPAADRKVIIAFATEEQRKLLLTIAPNSVKRVLYPGYFAMWMKIMMQRLRNAL